MNLEKNISAEMQPNEEQTIIVSKENRPMPENGKIDFGVQYCDEFYEEYIQNFCPNKKKRLFFGIALPNETVFL